MLASLATNIASKVRWLLSYVPVVGKFFAADKTNTESKRDSIELKDLHEDKTSWNEGILSRVRQFGTRISANLFQGSLFKLFLTDQSVPGLDPSKFESYGVEAVDIVDLKRGKSPLSKKYFITRKNSDISKQPIAVLTHGVKTTGRNMGKLSKRLIDMNYGVLVGDLVGFGVNKNKRLNELNLIADVKATIKEATKKSPEKPLTLISHSMGTALQTNALARIFQEEEESGNYSTKVKDLVLVSPWDKIASLIQDYHDSRDFTKIKEAVSSEDSISDFLDKNQDRAEELAKAVFGSNWDTLDSLHQVLEMNKLRPPQYRIQNINVIHGQEDPFVSYERSKALISLIFALHERGDMILPNARFCLIDDGNHFDMQSDENQTYFPISNIAQLLRNPPRGIESGNASFGKANYAKTQVEKLNNSDLLALAA